MDDREQGGDRYWWSPSPSEARRWGRRIHGEEAHYSTWWLVLAAVVTIVFALVVL